MARHYLTACLALVLAACATHAPIARSPVTLRAGSNDFKLSAPVTPLFRRQGVLITLAGVVMRDRLDYPSKIHLLFDDGRTLTLSASVVGDDGTELPLIYPNSSCGLNVADRCTIGFEADLPGRPVVTVRLNASGPATVKWMGWHDRMLM